MRSTSLSGPRTVLTAGLFLVLSGCAFSIPEVSPADIPQLWLEDIVGGLQQHFRTLETDGIPKYREAFGRGR